MPVAVELQNETVGGGKAREALGERDEGVPFYNAVHRLIGIQATV